MTSWVDGRSKDGLWLTTSCRVDDWRVEFAVQIGSPYYGVERVAIEPPTDVKAASAAIEANGMPVSVLRALPLTEARTRLARAKLAHKRGPTADAPIKVPARLMSPADWTAFAVAYVDTVNEGYRNPVEQLRQALGGVSRDTITARIRRARETGYLALDENNRPTLGPNARGEK